MLLVGLIVGLTVVALLAEGVDRNQGLGYPAGRRRASPSSRKVPPKYKVPLPIL